MDFGEESISPVRKSFQMMATVSTVSVSRCSLSWLRCSVKYVGSRFRKCRLSGSAPPNSPYSSP